MWPLLDQAGACAPQALPEVQAAELGQEARRCQARQTQDKKGSMTNQYDEAVIRANAARAASSSLRCPSQSQLSENVILKAEYEGPLVLSEMFMRYWIGKSRPTEKLEGWLSDRGYDIFPGVDHRGGFQIQKKDSGAIPGGLF